MKVKPQSSTKCSSISENSTDHSADLLNGDISTSAPEESMNLLFSYYISPVPDFEAMLAEELNRVTDQPECPAEGIIK